MREPITKFRPSGKSSEFWRWVAFFIPVWLVQFTPNDLSWWAMAVCILCSGYAISRGIHKKGRLDRVGKGERTTEFYVTLIGTLSIGFRILSKHVPMGVGLISMALIEVSYYLSRGNSKSVSNNQMKAILLR